MTVEVLTPQKPVAPAASIRPQQAQIHPCIAYPDLYPVEGPQVVAGRIHYYAVKILDQSLDRHLQRTGATAYEIAGDVYLHAKGGKRRVAPDLALYLAPRSSPSVGAFAVEHDGPPDLVIEVLSEGTWRKDVGVGSKISDKKHFYAEAGVREYWIYDPEEWRSDGILLQGFQLQANGLYREILPQAERWPSDVLGTQWGLSEPQPGLLYGYSQMRLINPETGTWYETMTEREEYIAAVEAELARSKAYAAHLEKRTGSAAAKATQDADDTSETA